MDERLDAIIFATAITFDVGSEDLVGRSRQARVVRARQTAMYLARELADLNFVDIGREFDWRDYTTVISACMRTRDRIETDEFFRQKVHALQQVVGLMLGELRGTGSVPTLPRRPPRRCRPSK